MLSSEVASLQVGHKVASDLISDHIISQNNSIVWKETYFLKKQPETDSRQSRGRSFSQQHLESKSDQLISSCNKKMWMTERSTVNGARGRASGSSGRHPGTEQVRWNRMNISQAEIMSNVFQEATARMPSRYCMLEAFLAVQIQSNEVILKSALEPSDKRRFEETAALWNHR